MADNHVVSDVINDDYGEVTGFQAGLTGDQQIRIALETIVSKGKPVAIQEIYDAVESHLNGKHLSDQGRASLRFFVNKVAVDAGYIYPHDRNNPGWRITPTGREVLSRPPIVEETVVNVDTSLEIVELSSAARGAAFELYVLELLKKMYPSYTWYHQGVHKMNERGLDFIGSRIGDHGGEAKNIGVQAKFHQASSAPAIVEWLKFLAGCFARRVDKAIFITSGKLTSEQQREAHEANVIVIEGRQEIQRVADQYNVQPFKLFEDDR